MLIKLFKATNFDKAKPDLEQVGEYSFVMKNESSITSPVIQLQADINGANYAQIEEYGRYYYILSTVNKSNDIVEISMKSDPLMSFYDQVMECDAIVVRQANNYNLYIEDSAIKAYSNPIVTQKKFPNGMNNEYFYLVAAG